jgi:hypothetical protein
MSYLFTMSAARSAVNRSHAADSIQKASASIAVGIVEMTVWSTESNRVEPYQTFTQC